MLAEYNKNFARQDIKFKVICSCPRRVLLFVYCEELLCKTLRQKEAVSYLQQLGYGEYFDLERYLQMLGARIQLGPEFPHELGVFLGYPVEDVIDFVTFGGRHSQLTGYWKVYHNIEKAKNIFVAYDRWKDYFLRRLAAGIPLHKVLLMA